MRVRELVRGLLVRLLRPAGRVIARSIAVDDPWERIDASVSPSSFGGGSVHDFGWYFEGASTVNARSPEEVHRWLKGCKYVPDFDLFHERDYWQHPCTFERIRQGDCEDFALWAWRQLVSAGHDADFVVGRCSFDPITGRARALFARHAWVILRKGEGTWLFETTARKFDQAFQPLDSVRANYLPEMGVGPKWKSFGFSGALLAAREEQMIEDERG